MQNKGFLQKLYLIAMVVGGLVGYFMLHQFCIPAETALRLSEASLMLEGQRLYVDFIDNATAFYLYLNFLSVLISRFTFIHPIAICNLLTAALFGASASTLAWLAHSHGSLRNPQRPAPICGWLILLTLSAITIFQPVHFAQANQIFFLALCPYIVLRAGTLRGLRQYNRLSVAVAVILALAACIDPLYLVYVLALEVCLFCGLYPFARLSFCKKRFLGLELKVFLAATAAILFVVAVLPTSETKEYLGVILKLNYYSFLEPLLALNYSGCAPDLRTSIYLVSLLLVAVMPVAGQNLLVRLFAIASILGFGLMILQGATLSYQTYLFVGFAFMAVAVGLADYLRRWKKFAPAGPDRLLNLGRKQLILSICGVFAGFAIATYLVQLFSLPSGYRFNLDTIGYYGLADRRDLAIFSEAVEEYSKPREPVAIMGLQVRPAYPVITQLRRKPGLKLTWGFPVDTMEMMEQPVYASDMETVRPFKKQLYAALAEQLGNRATAPVFIMLDGDEVRRVLEEREVFKVVEENYNICGGASMEDASSRDGHPPVEKLGYKAGFTIYRQKPAKLP
ncbi:MAG: hypothetical protein JSS86_03340 [Cyanobacteria bacterium SZAS LIN-2]|nr:hypothetical protein [Cyanobacteria bacterium SZAS LIN-2]